MCKQQSVKSLPMSRTRIVPGFGPMRLVAQIGLVGGQTELELRSVGESPIDSVKICGGIEVLAWWESCEEVTHDA